MNVSLLERLRTNLEVQLSAKGTVERCLVGPIPFSASLNVFNSSVAPMTRSILVAIAPWPRCEWGKHT